MALAYFCIPFPPQLFFKSFSLINRNRDKYAGREADQVSGLAENTSAFPLPGPDFTGQCRGTSAGSWRAPHRRCACTSATTPCHRSPCAWPSPSMEISAFNTSVLFLFSENRNQMAPTAFSSDSKKSAVAFVCVNFETQKAATSALWYM